MTNEERADRIIALLCEIRDILKPNSNSGAPRAASSGNRSTISYAKLRSGDWAIRSSVKVTPGQNVEVHTKDGKVKHETVKEVVFTGTDQQTRQPYYLCSIVPRGKDAVPASSTPSEAPPPEEDDVPF